MENYNKMRICMLIEAWKPVWAGGQIHVWELCTRLVRDFDCEVDLFVMNLKGKDDAEKFPEEENHCNGKLRIFRIGKKCSQDFISRIKWGRTLQTVIPEKHRDKPYDLIHAMANFPGWPGKKLSKKLKIPLIFTVHGSGLEAIKDMYGSGLKSKFIYFTENYLQTKIEYEHEITVDSSFLRFPNRNKKITVIPNGVNLEKFDSVKLERSSFFKILWVGRLHPQKGLTYLLDALSHIKAELEQKRVEVHLIGGGELEEELREKAVKLELSSIVKFRGKVYGEELIKEYKSAHLFVLPSLYEGQPLTLLEAWAAKLPVIVTDVGGNRDFVVEGENGYLIPAKDVNIIKESNNVNEKEDFILSKE
ncbi:MAG: glycosyltransferase family 4 protein, partial [Nanoarchaeota archaeon]